MLDKLPPLTGRAKTAYCSGEIANTMVYQIANAFLLIYYTDVFGISPLAAATLFLVARVWDAINDPIVGSLIDRTNTRWGRFRPWLAGGAIPCALFFVAMFTIPFDNMSEASKLVYAYVTYIGFGMAYTCVNLPYLSMVAAISDESTERSKLLAMRQALAFLGMVCLVLVPIYVQNSTKANPYGSVAAIAAVAAVIVWGICVYTVKERIDLGKASEDSGQKISFKGVFNYVIGNKPFMIIVLVLFLQFAQMSIGNSAAMYMFKYYIGDIASLSKVMLAQMGGALIGILMVTKLLEKFEKKWLYVVGMIFITGRFFLFYTKDVDIIIASAFFFNIFGGWAGGLIWSFIPDSIEYGEHKTGLRIDGISNAIVGFFWKLGFAVGGLVPGLILSFYHYVPNQTQTEEAIRGIEILGINFPIACSVLIALLMTQFPITKNAHAKIVEELHERRRLAASEAS